MPINVYAAFTVPVLLLVVAEVIYCLVKKNGYYTYQDSISSLGTAIVNQSVNLLVAAIFYPAYSFLSDLWQIWHPAEKGFLYYSLLFIGIDFLFYWFHRKGHTMNMLWAAHMPHHSTEEMNYAVALRASITQRFFSFFFYWPLTLFFPAGDVLAMVAFHLVLQLIPHTRVIPKLPNWIESWMNTPSHHRVHHACNKCYIDKNYGGFLIIWDKIFGSYADEIEKPFYGVTTPPRTWDPTYINLQWWWYLFSDSIQTKNWWDKIRLWFMPTGWRPSDLPPRKTYVYSHTVPTSEWPKFSSKEMPGTRAYTILSLFVCLGLMFLSINTDSPFTTAEKWAISLFLWVTCTCWSGFLESRTWAKPVEFIRIAVQALLLTPLFNQYYPAYVGNLVIAFSVLQLIWLLQIHFFNNKLQNSNNLNAAH